MRIARTILGSFTPLQESNFRRYMSGQAISLIGTAMQLTGQAWVVWELSHSPAALGLVAMLAAIPSLLLAPWVGALADRLERRRLLTTTAILAMLLAFALALLVQTGLVRLWHVYLLATLLGCVSAFDQPAQNAFLGDLAGVKDALKSFTMNAMAIQVSRMLGPALAGFVMARIGVATTFWLNGLSYVAVAYSLLRVQAQQVRYAAAGSPLRDFGRGIAFMARRPRITDLVLFTGSIVFFGFQSMQIFPAFVTAAFHGGPQELGTLLSAFGAGALVSALIVVPLVQQIRRTGMMLCAVAIWAGAWYFLLSRTHTLWLGWGCLFLAAFGQPVVMTVAKSMIQRLSPPHMWGRLAAVQITVSSGGQPFAAFGLGWLAEWVGTPLAIGISSGLLVLSGVAMLLGRPGLAGWEPAAAGQYAAD